MKKRKNLLDNINASTVITYTLVVFIIFVTVHFIGTLTGVTSNQETTATETVQTVVTETTAVTNCVETTTQISATTAYVEPVTRIQVDEDTTEIFDSGEVEIEETSEDGTTLAQTYSLSTADLVEMFNNGANNVKLYATEVVLEYKNIYLDPDKLVVPSAIESICQSAISTYVTGSDDPVSFTTSEEIIENFPKFGETWSAKAEESDIKSATYVDNGDTYTIQLDFETSINPEVEEGVESAFPTANLSAMSESTSIIQNVYIEYSNCSITAEIDKATGNLISVVYVMPLVMQMDIKFGFTLTAGAGIDYEYCYTIIY